MNSHFNGEATPRRRRRPGSAMVLVLIVILMISLMGTSLVRHAVSQHRQRRLDETRAQAVRLAEAGWNRALRNLAVTPAYSGETWELGEKSLPSGRTATVRIEIQPQDAPPNSRRLRIVAEYPAGSPLVNRVTLEDVVTTASE